MSKYKKDAEPQVAKWRDISGFDQDDKVREPNAFEIKFGKFRIVVHRHTHYPKEQWLATCYPDVFRQYPLPSLDLAIAQEQAITLLRRELATTIVSIDGVEGKGEPNE